MNKREAERRTMQDDNLRRLGFTQQEAEQLRRISMTLQRWHELECGIEGGGIERDEKTGRPYWVYSGGGFGTRRSNLPIADRETGARKRLANIIRGRNIRMVDAALAARPQKPAELIGRDCKRQKLSAYIQTDPRGAALYIIRPGDVPDGGAVESYYNRGLCVY